MSDTHRPRVLVIDDDPSVREIVSLLLESLGYDCETASDGRSGLVRVGEGAWNLVLLDLAMPEMSGWEVIDAIRQQAPTLPVALITGRSDDPAVRRRARDCGVLVIISKPFSLQTLKAALVEALHAKLA